MLSSIRTWNTEYRHCKHAQVQRGEEVPDPHPLENTKAIGFLWYTVPEPVGNHKATKPASNVGPSSARQRRVRGCCPTFSCILGFLMLVGGLDGV